MQLNFLVFNINEPFSTSRVWDEAELSPIISHEYSPLSPQLKS